jgi:hypothetical protein
MRHDEIAGVLGAYALDATDADETIAVSDHIAGCPRCAAEVAEHHEVVGLIANAGADAPPELWDRIAARIAGASPGERSPAPLSLVSTTPADSSAPIVRRRRRVAWSAAGAVAAAAAAVIALLAVQVGRLDNRVSQLDAANRQGGLSGVVLGALVDPRAHQVVLASPPTAAVGGQAVAKLVILPDGSAFALNAHLPRLGVHRTYQLWGIVNGRAVSLGVLGSHPTYVAFRVDPSVRVSAFAVTDETAGGAAQPTRSPSAQSTTSA